MRLKNGFDMVWIMVEIIAIGFEPRWRLLD